MRVYLAGPINGCTDAEMNGWREDLKRRMPTTEFIDPTVRDYRNGYSNAAHVVEPDKADIDASDIVLAHCPTPSVGTSMEVLYAWERGKHVVIYSPPEAVISPWLRYHSHRIFQHGFQVAAHLASWGLGCCTSPTPVDQT